MAYVGRAVFFIKERRIMFKTGDIIDGRYEIKEQIGSGGGGIVYKAYHLTMKKDVAIKLIKNVHSSDLENRSEVDLMKNLKSKYFPIFYDFIESGGNVYTVMEYINGHDIKSLVEMGKKFDEATITRCGIQLCCAAQELHSQCPPIIHGDIKPAKLVKYFGKTMELPQEPGHIVPRSCTKLLEQLNREWFVSASQALILWKKSRQR